MNKVYAFYHGYDDWDNPVYSVFFETKEDALCFVKQLIEKKVEGKRRDVETLNTIHQEILKNIDLAIEKGILELQPYICGDKIKEFYETFERLKANGCPISISEPWGKGKGYSVDLEKERGVYFCIQCIPDHSPEYMILEDLNRVRKHYNELEVFNAEEIRKEKQYIYNHIDQIELWKQRQKGE